MRNYTQQTDRIRDKTLMTRSIKEVKQCISSFNPAFGVE